MESNRYLALAGRVFIATIFLASAFGKLTSFERTSGYISAQGLPAPQLLCAAAVAVEALGGLSLLLGFHARLGALALAAFLVPVTLVFHGSADQRLQLLKNLAIMGGLLLAAAHGPGELSLDRKA